MRCSLIPKGRQWVSFIRLVLMASPTPCSLSSSAGFPHQKKVKPAPASLSTPSSASLVLLNAVILMWYHASSFPIRAVLLSGLEVTFLSSNVQMFQTPRMSCLSFKVSLVVLAQLFIGWSASCGRTGNVWVTFSNPFPHVRVGSAICDSPGVHFLCSQFNRMKFGCLTVIHIKFLFWSKLYSGSENTDTASLFGLSP